MLWKRVVSACVFVPILLIGIFVGRWVWPLLVAVIACLALKEYCELGKKHQVNVPFVLPGLGALLILLAQYFEGGVLQSVALLVTILLFVVWLLYTKPDILAFAYGLTGVLMIGWTFSTLIALQQLGAGWQYVLLAFLIPWLTDTGAYFIGMLIGKHKMAPVISPKKSWEGAVAGVVFGVAAVLIYNQIVMGLPWWLAVIIGLCGSVVGQLGDLLESWLKRWAGVKDSGRIIPGHGGILDRFDSTILVAPTVYVVLAVYLMLIAS